MSGAGESGIVVSVIVPFLDPRPEFLREAVESVLAQTFSRWELLLVDDGSAGGAVDVARTYAERHPGRIRYLHHEGHRNLGHSASRNLGLRHAGGRYVAFLDADDVWLPRKLEEQAAILSRHPEVGMLYGCSLYWFSWTGQPEDRKLDYTPPLGVPRDSVLTSPPLLAYMLRGEASVPCPCSVVARRAVVERVGGFDEAFTGLFEDQVFYAKLSLHAPVYAASTCWDRYRRHPESLCATASRAEEIAGRRTFLEWVLDYLRRTGTDDGTMSRAAALGLWELDHPLAARILRSGRRVRRRARRMAAWVRGADAV